MWRPECPHAHYRRPARRGIANVQADGKDEGVGADELAHALRGEPVVRAAAQVIRPVHTEEARGEAGTADLAAAIDGVPPDALEGAGYVEAERDCRVEAAAGDGSCAVATGHDGEADREVIEPRRRQWPGRPR